MQSFRQCTVSDSGRALIDRYKVGEYILASYTLRGSQPIEFNIRGQRPAHRTDDIATLLKLEEEMKFGGNNLKALLAVMASFGGEQVFESSEEASAGAVDRHAA